MKTSWRRKWQPTPVFLPGESHGQRSLAGYSPRGCKESDMTEHPHTHCPHVCRPIYLSAYMCVWFPRWLSGKQSTCNAGDPGSIPRLGRSPGEGNGNPLQYSCLRNPMDRGAWWLQSMGSQKSDTTVRLSMQTHMCVYTSFHNVRRLLSKGSTFTPN